MVRALILLVMSIASAQVSAAQQGFQSPQPGTMITWKYEFGDQTYIRLNEVVISGEDFIIYDPDIQRSSGEAADYIVEFSGVHSQSCDQPLPGDEDRAALSAIWPLIPGASASVRTGVKSVYSVAEPVKVELISNIEGAGDALSVQTAYGEAEMTLAVSPVLGMPVQVVWASGDKGQVLEVIEPQGGLSPTDMAGQDLGYCSELLE